MVLIDVSPAFIFFIFLFNSKNKTRILKHSFWFVLPAKNYNLGIPWFRLQHQCKLHQSLALGERYVALLFLYPCLFWWLIRNTIMGFACHCTIPVLFISCHERFIGGYIFKSHMLFCWVILFIKLYFLPITLQGMGVDI